MLDLNLLEANMKDQVEIAQEALRLRAAADE